jgi:hypothetical protein
MAIPVVITREAHGERLSGSAWRDTSGDWTFSFPSVAPFGFECNYSTLEASNWSVESFARDEAGNVVRLTP